MTFNTLLRLCRLAVAVVAAGVCALMLGPFQGLERQLGMSDVVAHGLAAFGITLLVFLIAPDRRRTDLAIMVLSGSVAIEIAQALTGRSLSVIDVLANGVGIVAALAPGYIEQVRRCFREQPFARVGAPDGLDRRRRPGRGPAASPVSEPVRTSVPGF